MSKLQQLSEEIDQELESKSKFVKLQDGETKVLQFDPEQIKIVEKDWQNNGKFTKKVEYTVVDPEDAEGNEKILTMSLTSAQMINKRLQKKETLLEVERFGTGTSTKYSFTPVAK